MNVLGIILSLVVLIGLILIKVNPIVVSLIAESFARAMIKLFVKKVAPLVLPVLIGILTYSGVTALYTIFILLPIALNVFKESDVPRRFITVLTQIGGGTFANCGVGSPQILNIVATGALGVSVSSGGIPGIVGTIAIAVSAILFLQLHLSLARKKGEHYVAHEMDAAYLTKANEDDDSRLPSPFLAVLVLALVPVLMNISRNGSNLFSPALALLLSSVVCYVLNIKRINIKEFFLKDSGERLQSVLWMTATLCSMSGYGAVIASTPGFQKIIDGALSAPGSPYIKLIIAVSIMSIATGGATASCNIVAPTLGPTFVGMGLRPEYVARVMAQAATGLDSLPNNGGVSSVISLCKCELKDAYPP